MTLTQLSYIVAVATHGGFQRAAVACGVTQPTLSMQVMKAEAALGVRIFDRSKQPVEPTDLGRLLVDQARVVLREAARLEELVSEAGGEVSGELRIGVIPTLSPYLLPRFVGGLSRLYPNLTLAVEEALTDQIMESIRSDRLDVGLLATPADERGILERPLFEEPFVGYLSDDHPLAEWCELRVDALDVDDLWLLHEGHCFRDQVLRLCRDDPRIEGPQTSAHRTSASRTSAPQSSIPHTDPAQTGERIRPLRFESGSLETLKRLVESSGGLTLLPALAVLDLSPTDRARVRPFAAPAPTRQIRLVHGKGYLKRGLIEIFVGSLLDALPAECERLE